MKIEWIRLGTDRHNLDCYFDTPDGRWYIKRMGAGSRDAAYIVKLTGQRVGPIHGNIVDAKKAAEAEIERRWKTSSSKGTTPTSKPDTGISSPGASGPGTVSLSMPGPKDGAPTR